jgi:hypothetical protein
VDDWQVRLDERRQRLTSSITWEDDEEIIDAHERATASDRILDAPGTLTPITAAEVLTQPRKTWVNPYDALLDEVRRTNAYVVMLGAEVDEFDREHGGAHRFRASRSTLARYERERDRLIAVASKCVSLGIAERSVRVAEREGELLARMAVAAVDAAGVTDEQRRIILTELAAQMRAGALPVAAG